MSNYVTDIYRTLGGQGPVPSASAKFLQAWQRKEGGVTNNNASFNWLNRTDKGYPTINKVGVVAYPNYQTGVSRTADLIRSGYPALAKAIVSGAVNLSDPSQQGDLNRWLSGKRTPGSTPYVQAIASYMGQSAGAVPASSSGGTTPMAPVAPLQQPYNAGMQVASMISGLRQLQQKRQKGESGGVLPLFGQLVQLSQTARASAPAPPVSTMVDATTGKTINTSSWTPTHVTDNLGWGTKTAGDIMAAPGTPVGAPEAGTIERYGSAQGGQSMYFKGASGKTYWLGHINQGLAPGTRVAANQPITTISKDHPRPHLHIDVRG